MALLLELCHCLTSPLLWCSLTRVAWSELGPESFSETEGENPEPQEPHEDNDEGHPACLAVHSWNNPSCSTAPRISLNTSIA